MHFDSKIPHPHDRFFKMAMSDPRVAREFFSALLPKDVLLKIDLNQLECQPGSYINDIRQESIIDLLYKTKFKETTGYLYLLVDHQSRPDKLMPFRILKYTCNIIDQHLKKDQSKKIPFILPLVIYHGALVWNDSTNINDLVLAPKSLVDAYFLKPFILIDLNRMEDVDLKQHVWSGSMLLTLKHIFKRDMLPYIYAIIELLKQIESSGRGTVETVLTYILDKGELDKKSFVELVKKEFSSDIGEKIMTISEQFREEGKKIGIKIGIEKGIEKGVEKGKIEVAKHLLAEKAELRFIQRVTGLSLVKIQELQEAITAI